MKNQIIRIMEAEGMSPARFADEIGVQRSNVSHILSDRNKPSYDFITKILKRFPEINAEWLLTGQGSMIRTNQSEKSQTETEKKLFDNKPIINKLSVNTRTPEREDKPKQFTNVNSIDYILVFYNDKTFERFNPRD